RAAVVDVGPRQLLLERLYAVERSLDPFLVTEDSDEAVHGLAQLTAQDRNAPAAVVGPADELADLALRVPERRLARARCVDLLRPRRGVLAGAAAEDERVEQGVGAQPVATVNRHARDLPGRVQPRHDGGSVDVGLDTAHRVVV